MTVSSAPASSSGWVTIGSFTITADSGSLYEDYSNSSDDHFLLNQILLLRDSATLKSHNSVHAPLLRKHNLHLRAPLLDFSICWGLDDVLGVLLAEEVSNVASQEVYLSSDQDSLIRQLSPNGAFTLS
ncbi:hypothetical protein ACH5RR_029537 [Cinchona calisaya]|uniref:Uncharacterized protein n=1 Tax=Cinchona calisaya TaxID=153742 RepID=A0ABD2YTD2_9GENT